MPRGRKPISPKSISEQIFIISEEITKTEEHLKDLKNRKKELQAQEKAEEIESIYQAIQKSGKSVDEVLAWLSVSEE